MKNIRYIIKSLFWLISKPFSRIIRLVAGYFTSESARRRRRANTLARQMLSELSRLGFSRKIVIGSGKRSRTKRQRVVFEQPLLMTIDELWCPIHHAKLPTGVSILDITNEEVIKSLEERIDCSVRVDHLANGKLCYVVRYGGAQFPEKITLNQIDWPADAPQLALPVGVNADGDHTFIDLDDVIHLLVAGATGNGKTVFGHAAISSLITRNAADELELWLIDLKQTEFNLYRPLWSKKGDGIVKSLASEPLEAIDILERAYREINRRNQLMAQFGATNFEDLMLSSGIRLPKVVIMIDEFAQLTLDTNKFGKQTIGGIAKNLITRIAALGRSAGFRIIIATQMVNADVISSLILSNFENRLAFSTATWRQSQMIVETSEAEALPRGRAVLRVKGVTTMVQTPFVTPQQVRIEVARVAEHGPSGWGEDRELVRFAKDARLLITVASQQFAGELPRNKMLASDGIKGVISFDRFNEVCRRLELDGIIEAGGPRKARRVSRGFLNRPSLVDSFYGVDNGATVDPPPTEGPTEKRKNDYGGPPPDTVGKHQEATEPEPDTVGDTVYGVEPSLRETPDREDDPEPPPPSWWHRIDPSAAPPAAPAPAELPTDRPQRRPRIAKPNKGRNR